MAGISRRNHYVPEFLLKRFASRVKGKTRWVWQFSKERRPVEISTRHAAVGELFYGEPDNAVERRLQPVEQMQAVALARIDRGDSPDAHADVLNRLIWMLSVRTRALRRHLASTGERLLDQLEESAASEEAKAALLATADRDFDDSLVDLLGKLPKAFGDRAMELLENDERREALRSFLLPQLRQLDIQEFFRWLREMAGDRLDMNTLAASGQIRGLSKSLDGAHALPAFSATHWTVIRRPPGTFLLGDSCVFALGKDGPATTLHALGREWHTAYLPISDSSVLVASRDPIDSVLPDDRINAASVEVGSDVFFASRCTAYEIGYTHKIGSGVPLLGDAEMARIARDSWRRMEQDAIHGGGPVARTGDP